MFDFAYRSILRDGCKRALSDGALADATILTLAHIFVRDGKKFPTPRALGI
jgi:hypothetical protein